MARLSDLPYLGNIHGGPQLRLACTKVVSYAQIDADRKGTFGQDKLVPFLLNQIDLGGLDHGLPSDGLNLELPGLDPRREFYEVLSALRMWGTPDQREAFNSFCWFMINMYKKPEKPKTPDMASDKPEAPKETKPEAAPLTPSKE